MWNLWRIPVPRALSCGFGVLAAQDVAKAGRQLGMEGKRTSLVQHVFRLLDLTKGRLGLQFHAAVLAAFEALCPARERGAPSCERDARCHGLLDGGWFIAGFLPRMSLQEFEKRSMVVRWAAVTGRMSGVPVRRLSVCRRCKL